MVRTHQRDLINEDGRLLSIAQLAAETPLQRQAPKKQVATAIKERKRKLKAISARGFKFQATQPTRPPIAMEVGSVAIEGIRFGTYSMQDEMEVYELILGMMVAK